MDIATSRWRDGNAITFHNLNFTRDFIIWIFTIIIQPWLVILILSSRDITVSRSTGERGSENGTFSVAEEIANVCLVCWYNDPLWSPFEVDRRNVKIDGQERRQKPSRYRRRPKSWISSCEGRHWVSRSQPTLYIDTSYVVNTRGCKVSIFLPRYILIIITAYYLTSQRVSSKQKSRDSDLNENCINESLEREMRTDREKERERIN